MKIHLGYCCVSMLHKELQCSRASTKTYLDKHSREHNHEYLISKAKKNLADLQTLLLLNHGVGIEAYRIPEQVLPQVDLGYYKIEELRSNLIETGRVANKYHIQLSTHPSQYYVLNSLRTDVVERTIHSLDLIAQTLEEMELKLIPNITLHLGMKNGYETVDEAIDEFCQNYMKLGEPARSYLVLENDHVSFTVDQCMKVHEQIGIPIVFDNKHYEWNTGDLEYEEAVAKTLKTWPTNPYRIPKLHLSSDRDTKKHAHSDYVLYPDYERMVTALEQAECEECNIMLECKQKDAALLKLRKEIKERETTNHIP